MTKKFFFKYEKIFKYKIININEITSAFNAQKENYKNIVNRVSYLIKKDSDAFYFNICNWIITDPKIFYQNYKDTFYKGVYFGGRVEIYSNSKIQLEKTYNWDLPSAYFNTLVDFFPVGEPEVIVYNSDASNLKIDSKSIYYLEVLWRESIMKDPVLPYRRDNNVIFPTGVFCGEWWGDEVLLFLEKGGIIKKVIKEYRFKEWKPFLKGFKEQIDLIEINNKDINFYIKAMKTSFYGNFCKKEKTLNIHSYHPNGDYFLNKKPLLIETNFIIGSLITSKVRIFMYNLMEDLKTNLLKPIACVTDSVYFINNSEFRSIEKSLEIFKINHPKYKFLWERREKTYKEIFFISPRYIFIKINKNYITTYGEKFNNIEMKLIKTAWFGDKLKTISIKKVEINLYSIKNREWLPSEFNCKNTNPIFVFQPHLNIKSII